jgi:hypothetical protein
MSLSLAVQITLAAVGSILIPCVFKLVGALNRNAEALTRLETKIADGVEPRLKQCEGDIGSLYTRTNRHGERLTALEARQHGR